MSSQNSVLVPSTTFHFSPLRKSSYSHRTPFQICETLCPFFMNGGSLAVTPYLLLITWHQVSSSQVRIRQPNFASMALFMSSARLSPAPPSSFFLHKVAQSRR